MIDWEILEDKPIPERSEEELPPGGIPWRFWAILLGLLLLVVALACGG